MQITKRRKVGFTLIELLVVIAIIAILAAILFPVFAQARSKARQITGTSNIKQMALGILMYSQDYDESFPRTGYGGETSDPNNAGDVFENQSGGNDWQNIIYPYVKNLGVYVSPGDASKTAGWFVGAADEEYPDGQFSLMMNDLLAHAAPTRADGYADEHLQQRKSTGLSQAVLNSSADCIMLAEGHGGWTKALADKHGPDATGSTDVKNKWHHEHTISGNFTPFISGTGYDGTVFFSGLPMYSGGANIAFCDGHAKWIKVADQSGRPVICSTLPWTKSMDPQQRGADKTASYCGGDNPVPAGFEGHNWY